LNDCVPDSNAVLSKIWTGKIDEMSINSETEMSADLQIGPTSLGMVRLFFVANEIEVPMDFTPEEAEEIAEEIKLAARRGREISGK
jgi:hypothetical protein